MNKNKFILSFCLVFCFLLIFSSNCSYAQPANGDYDTYTVVRGDSLWKIAVKYQVGLSEIIAANKQFKNPNLIYPGDKVYVPLFSDIKAIEREVINLTNQQRQKNGLPPLKYNWQLSRVARYKSADMRDKNYFSHTSPTYGSPAKMISDFGLKYTAMGENIAMGQRTAWEVVDGWMNSSGHRANILNKNYTEIGVGYAKSSSGKTYWTQMFIRP
ncbi:SafA/ExsA family spore coat assembly protein [Abyssisolibacter fermentans]|uniref:SafA/ExsA family spore coat assembly protein n=1 Tax=Abyssisolibacter fermentans TaxID=1766203 RepID=UPI000ACBCB94|nr:SafA/ExsA family spore coat assembly protein [Abyssisolibacter fermentans]